MWALYYWCVVFFFRVLVCFNLLHSTICLQLRLTFVLFTAITLYSMCHFLMCFVIFYLLLLLCRFFNKCCVCSSTISLYLSIKMPGLSNSITYASDDDLNNHGYLIVTIMILVKTVRIMTLILKITALGVI